MPDLLFGPYFSLSNESGIYAQVFHRSSVQLQQQSRLLKFEVTLFPSSKRSVSRPALDLLDGLTKNTSIGRSSDNRRFCSPNYSAWRRSRTESLLSNARYSISSPPCARFARPLGAPRTAHFATPPLGAGAFVIAVVDFFWLGLKGKESR
jgi:hypothetical protein